MPWTSSLNSQFWFNYFIFSLHIFRSNANTLMNCWPEVWSNYEWGEKKEDESENQTPSDSGGGGGGQDPFFCLMSSLDLPQHLRDEEPPRNLDPPGHRDSSPVSSSSSGFYTNITLNNCHCPASLQRSTLSVQYLNQILNLLRSKFHLCKSHICKKNSKRTLTINW